MVEATGLGRGGVTSLLPDADSALSTWLRDHTQAIESELAALEG